MISTIIDILPSAIGIAISPIPIVAVILMLMSKRAKGNGLAFVAGWIIALFAVSGVILWLAAAGKLSTGGDPSPTTKVIMLIVGVLMILLAIKNWLGRPKPGQTPDTPGWMAMIDNFTAVMSFGIAVVLAAVNPKNLLLIVAGALTIVASGATIAEEVVLVIVFAIIASLTVALPVIYYLIAPASARTMLTSMKGWLIRYNAVILAALLLVIGIKMIWQSI